MASVTAMYKWAGLSMLFFLGTPLRLLGVDRPNTSEGGILDYVNRLAGNQKQSWIDEQLRNYRDFPRLDLAFRLMSEGRLPEARHEVERLLSRKPKDMAAQSVEMAILAEQKDYTATLQVADRLLARYNSFPPARIYRGLALQALGRNDEALANWVATAKIRDLNTRDYLHSLDTVLDLSLSEKKYAQALEAAEELSKMKRDAYLYYRKSLALQGLSRTDDAEAAVETALELASSDDQKVNFLELAGDLRYGQQRWSAAAALYERALKLRPADPDIWRRLSHAAYQNRDYSGSAQAMERCLTLRSRVEDEQYLANVLIAAKDYAAADERLRMILAETQQSKDSVPVYRQLIEVARLRKDNAAALRYVRSLLRLHAGQEEQDLLFTLLREQGNYPAMINELESFVSRPSADAVQRYEALIELGNLYEIQHDFNKAADAFGRAVDLNRCVQSLTLVAESLGQAGRNGEAVRFTEEALRLEPSSESYVRLANLYTRLGKIDNALHALDAALNNNPSAARLEDIYRQQGYLYIQAKKLDKAEAAFSYSLKTNPDDPELLKAVSEVCFERHEYDIALRYLEKIPQPQKTTDTKKMLALAYTGIGDFSRAASEYQEILASAPRPSQLAEEARMGLAAVETQEGQFEEAARDLSEAFHDGGDKKPELLLESAERFSQAQKDREAIKAYQSLLDRRDINSTLRGKAWVELGYLYVKLGDNTSAVAAFRYALEVGADGSALHKSLAYSYYALKDWKSALHEFLSTSKKEATPDPSTFIAVGWCYKNLGQPGLAIYFLEQGLKAGAFSNEAERASLLNELGFLYYSVQEYAAAADTWQKSLGLQFQPSVCIQLARARAAQKDFSGAALALSQLKPGALAPQERVDYFDQSAQIAKERGDITSATQAYLHANQIAPAAWRDYQLGLNLTETGDFAASVAHFRDALAKEPANLLYLKALAYGLEQAGQLAEAEKIYEQLARLDAQNATWYRSLGYTNLKLGRTAQSIRWFEEAIDASGSGNNADASGGNYALRSELANISRSFDLTLYQGFVSSNYAVSPIGGDPFPATSGIDFGYRPPKIGFRNGRIFEPFTRLLWSNNHNVPVFDTKYYQLSVGVRYKPLAKQNLWISAERLLHTGTPAYRGWMFRGLFSVNPGYELRPGHARWSYSYVYSDSVYLPQSALFSQYGELRRGVAFNIHNKLLITPFAVADARWQSENLFNGTYAEAGGGVSFRFLYNSNHYEANRSSFEIVATCKRGTVFSNYEIGFSGCAILSVLHF